MLIELYLRVIVAFEKLEFGSLLRIIVEVAPLEDIYVSPNCEWYWSEPKDWFTFCYRGSQILACPRIT